MTLDEVDKLIVTTMIDLVGHRWTSPRKIQDHLGITDDVQYASHIKHLLKAKVIEAIHGTYSRGSTVTGIQQIRILPEDD